MVHLDAAPVKMAVPIEASFGLEQFSPAGKNEVSLGEKLSFPPHQLGRRKAKLRKFVHAIVDNGGIAQLVGESLDRHWIVKPLDGLIELSGQRSGERAFEQRVTLRIDPDSIAEARLGKKCLHDRHGRKMRDGFQFVIRLEILGQQNRAFDKKDAMIFGEPREELLRTLPDSVPPQMRMNDDRKIVRAKFLREKSVFGRQ